MGWEPLNCSAVATSYFKNENFKGEGRKKAAPEKICRSVSPVCDNSETCQVKLAFLDTFALIVNWVIKFA